MSTSMRRTCSSPSIPPLAINHSAWDLLKGALAGRAQGIIFITMLLFAFKVYASGLYPIGSIEKVWNNLNRMAEPDAVPVAGEGARQTLSPAAGLCGV